MVVSIRMRSLPILLNSLSPATFFTKICIVSPAAAEEARDDVDDNEDVLLERCMSAVVIRVLWRNDWVMLDSLICSVRV